MLDFHGHYLLSALATWKHYNPPSECPFLNELPQKYHIIAYSTSSTSQNVLKGTNSELVLLFKSVFDQCSISSFGLP